MFHAPDTVGLDQLDDLGLAVDLEQRVPLWESSDEESEQESASAS
jgi:hypothetical protein